MFNFIWKGKLPYQFVNVGVYSFSGICFGDYGFGILHKRRLTEEELDSIVDFFLQEGNKP